MLVLLKCIYSLFFYLKDIETKRAYIYQWPCKCPLQLELGCAKPGGLGLILASTWVAWTQGLSHHLLGQKQALTQDTGIPSGVLVVATKTSPNMPNQKSFQVPRLFYWDQQSQHYKPNFQMISIIKVLKIWFYSFSLSLTLPQGKKKIEFRG